MSPPESHPRISQGPILSTRDQARSPGESPISWSTVIPTARREQAIAGVLLGGATAESLGQVHRTLNRRTAIARLRRSRKFRLPQRAWPNHRTHSQLMAIQSVLRSRANVDDFADALRHRLKWYRLSQPVRSIASWLFRIATQSKKHLIASYGNDPMVRASLLSVVLQGHNDSALRWIQRSSLLASRDDDVCQAATLVAIAAQKAQMDRTRYAISNQEVFPMLMEATKNESIADRLKMLDGFLKKRRSVTHAAAALGYPNGLTGNMVDSALIAIYAWARNTESYERCITQILRLGGNTSHTASIAGCLCGIQHGIQGIPERWLERVTLFPNGTSWVESYVERIRDWPHGPEDIQKASALPIMPIRQLIRNALLRLNRMRLIAAHLIQRIFIR
ncbi:MAG: ADP-ribosylglycohydrolase family protein [Planctomycetes bacterium]|nr:ADP-ribosylglycohydrolase family protein [Planctomycetota bacterium]